MTRHCRFCAEEIQFAALICRFCGREQRIREEPTTNLWHSALAVITVLVLGGGIALAAIYANLPQSGDAVGELTKRLLPPPPPPPPPPPFALQIADEPYQRLNAGGYSWYPFELTDNRACRLRGHIQVTDGGSHDVEMFVTDQDGFVNFQNGNGVNTYLHERRTSAVTLDLPVRGFKKYYLVVSNRFSLFTGKTVSLQDIRGVCGDVDGDGVGDV
ncbi:MAG TPA: emp24/gp25L/p24 family protein [Longimicrobium sp.]|nr:emp24/gp25L/p24 family protein [Longimicrobium sp.]